MRWRVYNYLLIHAALFSGVAATGGRNERLAQPRMARRLLLTKFGGIAFQTLVKADPGVKSIWGYSKAATQERRPAQASTAAQRDAVRRVLLADQY